MFLENTVWPLSVSEMGVWGGGIELMAAGSWVEKWLDAFCTLKERPIYLLFFHVLVIEPRMSLERIGQMVTPQPHLYPKRYIPPTHFTMKAGATIVSMAACHLPIFLFCLVVPSPGPPVTYHSLSCPVSFHPHSLCSCSVCHVVP